jgi:hypothetical protein
MVNGRPMKTLRIAQIDCWNKTGGSRDTSSAAVYTYSKPLGIVSLADAEEGVKRVVARNHKASEVGKKLSAKVEEDEEEVKSNNAEESIDLWDGCLLLEVVQGRVFGQLDSRVSIRWAFKQAFCRSRLYGT